MAYFNRAEIEALKGFIYAHYSIHDSNIEELIYDREQRTLTVEAVNHIFNERMKLIFGEVKVFLSISGNWQGNRDTILALVVEDDYLFLQNCKQVCGNCFDNSLYMVFQMFSGDELHIVSESVIIEGLE